MGRIINLGANWLFHLGDEAGADYMGWDDRAWRRVTLPHDWSVEHPFDRAHSSGTGYLPGGTAWYRKHFDLPEDVGGMRVRVTFGGVYKNSAVWINSNYLGKRPYGYSTFTYDITPFARPGENVLAVRVEHEQTADSRWFTGSGIYRDVTAELSDPVSFETDGIFVATREISEDRSSAVLNIEYEAAGEPDRVSFALLDGDGTECASAESLPEKAGGTAMLTVEDPALWSPADPALYTLVGRTWKEGRVRDERRIKTGIRSIRFDGDTGFRLNGINMKLKGVCVHHDAGALGAAVPKEVWRRRLEAFRAAGTNAIRTAHNPPDPGLLDLCDEMGFLVMDEAFDEWEGPKNKWWQGHNVYPPKRYGYAEDFPAWHRADLEAMVKRDRNRPSVILWSIGNEIDYPNDPYVTPLFDEVLGNNDGGKPAAERRYDDKKPDASRLAVMAKELTDIVHALDSTRPVTSALSFPELSNRTGYADALDVVGYNYKEQFYEEDHRKYPGRVIYGSENGKGAREWAFVRDNDYICGQFLWTGVDFLGECPGWPMRISQAGILDLAGFPKPNFWHRRAMWSEGADRPFVKLSACPALIRWDSPDVERASWQIWPPMPQRNGRRRREEPEEEPDPRLTDPVHPLMRVSCCTDAAAFGGKVELFLNGRSLGVKDPAEEAEKAREAGKVPDPYRVAWEVPYEDGELAAVVLMPHGKPAENPDSTPVADVLRTPGRADRLILTEWKPQNGEISAPGESSPAARMAQIEVLLADAEGTPAADEEIRFQLLGDGEIAGIENGSPDDLTPYAAKYRRTNRGRAVVYVRLFGDAVLFARTESGIGGEKELRVRS